MPTRRRNVSTAAFALALGLAATAPSAWAQAPASPLGGPLPPSAPPIPATAPAPSAPPSAAPSPPALAPAPVPPPGPRVSMPPAVPQPMVPDLTERSGVVGRMIPINPHLPPDPKRDQWYDTRWGDEPNRSKFPNFYRNGGLYGIPWRSNHTASIYPYFFGAPGQNTLRGDERRVGYFGRLPKMLFHPFQPIGMYYDQGSYVPVYDLDPLVTGPTAWPWPWFRRLTSAGG